MWCIPEGDREFIGRMEDVLNLYQQPYDPKEPVVCFDEKCKQLLQDLRPRPSPKPGRSQRYDYEYRRNGTRHLFLCVEPKAGYREVTVTHRRTKQDFAQEIRRLLQGPYRAAERVHLVLDNLNTHGEASLRETFGEPESRRLRERLCWHYTPKHASWLNMAEIEMSILGRQCLPGRIPSGEKLQRVTSAWQRFRNDRKATITWRFTTLDARRVFRDYYQTELTE
jgi:hypothetical protein